MKIKSAIEQVIGCLKHDFLLIRNWLKGNIYYTISIVFSTATLVC